MWVNYCKQLFNIIHCVNYIHLNNQIPEFILINNAIVIIVYRFESLSKTKKELLMLI